jgi:hypothetical protein
MELKMTAKRFMKKLGIIKMSNYCFKEKHTNFSKEVGLEVNREN